MKKLLAILLATLLCLSFAACGANSNPKDNEPVPEPIPEVVEPETPEEPESNEPVPPTGGAGVTTNDLINETWEWMDAMPSYDDRKAVTYEQIVERLGDEGEWIDSDTNADKGAVHFKWNDPNGGVIRLEFRPNESGVYCYAQGNISGTT